MDESNRKKIIRKGIFALLFIVLVWNVIAVDRGSEKEKGFSLREYIFAGIQEKVLETILPFASFQTEDKGELQQNLLEEMATEINCIVNDIETKSVVKTELEQLLKEIEATQRRINTVK